MGVEEKFLIQYKRAHKHAPSGIVLQNLILHGQESCHFQVVVLPVSAVTASVATVICHHQQNGRTSTLIHVLSLGVPLACLVYVVSVGMM